MNIVANVLEDKKKIIPAITHIDGTARVHTVSYESNPLYYNLLKKFGEETGIPVLLNTSFNIQEPIVRSPTDAIKTFLKSGVDLLIIGNYICDIKWKNKNLAK
jgi:carbamoyltransferase